LVVTRLSRVAGPSALLLLAFAALLACLAYGGGASVPKAIDPGAVVRYGLPVANLLVNLGEAGAIGALVMASFVFVAKKPEFGRALDVAAASSALWAVSSAVTAFFTFQSVDPQPVSLNSQFGDSLSQFLTGSAIGQAWFAQTLMAAALTVVCFAVRNHTALGIVTILSIFSLIPVALQGHAGDLAGHDAATTSIWLHVVFAAIWLGGLLTIILSQDLLEKKRVVVVIERYSALALVCFIGVAVSGYVNAEIRLETLPNLLTPYGILVLVKVFAIGALGLFGIVQRRFFIGKIGNALTGARKYFWWMIAGELAFMGIASGTAVALSRTADPQLPDNIPAHPSGAFLLTNTELPPVPNLERYFTMWNFDLLWVVLCGFGLFFYLAAVVRLHRRGDRWPIHRTVLWVAGILVLFYITNGGVNVYQEYLFSAHMISHMVLGMMIPVLLAPAAPITLALRAIHKRQDGSRGGREWLMIAVHSRLFRFFANPIVAPIFFVASLWIFYYTPLFSWASTDHIGHEWMIIHFLIVGYLFVSTLIGVDPVPYRPPYPLRLVILLGTMAFHAFFGLSLITGTGLLSADWYGAMGWGPAFPALSDQQSAGGIAWSIGELPTLALAVAVAFMWSRSDARESKRYDRKAERDGGAELEEYNAMLARRASRDAGR
jgi:cytochrome c oxidase assembly factor CtaG/putative copper export protein